MYGMESSQAQACIGLERGRKEGRELRLDVSSMCVLLYEVIFRSRAARELLIDYYDIKIVIRKGELTAFL